MQNFALKIYGNFSRLGALRVTFNKNVLDILMRPKFQVSIVSLLVRGLQTNQHIVKHTDI